MWILDAQRSTAPQIHAANVSHENRPWCFPISHCVDYCIRKFMCWMKCHAVFRNYWIQINHRSTLWRNGNGLREIERDPILRDSNIQKNGLFVLQFLFIFRRKCDFSSAQSTLYRMRCGNWDVTIPFVRPLWLMFFLKMNLSFVIMIDWLKLTLLKLLRVCAAHTGSLHLLLGRGSRWTERRSISRHLFYYLYSSQGIVRNCTQK